MRYTNDLLTLTNALLVGMFLALCVLVGTLYVSKATYRLPTPVIPSVTSHSVIVTGPVCEEDAAIVGFGEYTAGFGYEYYKCIPMDDLPLPAWPL